MDARAERKLAKKQTRATVRGTKRRDILIQQQDEASATALRNREEFAQKRAAFDTLNINITEIHEKQRKNLINAQERKLKSDKSLNEYETRHLKPEIRSTIAKKFRNSSSLILDVRQSFQMALNKRINDQLREYQLMELRHIKERFELELSGFEEQATIKNKQANNISQITARHVEEHHAEKEFL